MLMKDRHSQPISGFTLIELSIALVIIGLLVGGILVGRDLIVNAQNRKLISSMEQFETVVNTFRNKYSCLPGDCTRAISFGLATQLDGSTVADGNGNGRIDADLISETYNMWVHLHNSGLMVARRGDNAYASPQPHKNTSILPADLGMLTIPMATIFTYALQSAYFDHGGSWTYTDSGPALSGFTAYYVDSKRDDGLPTTGKIIAAGPFTDFVVDLTGIPDVGSISGGGNPLAGPGGETSYVCINTDTTPVTYNMRNAGDATCILLVQPL